MSTSEPPVWPYCADGADPASDPVGCRAIRVPGRLKCLAHLNPAHRADYLAGLTPGDSIDCRATTFAWPLLYELLDALRDPATGDAHLGEGVFESATFEYGAEFTSATFEGDAVFHHAPFKTHARFTSMIIKGRAWFQEATFWNGADFKRKSHLVSRRWQMRVQAIAAKAKKCSALRS